MVDRETAAAAKTRAEQMLVELQSRRVRKEEPNIKRLILTLTFVHCSSLKYHRVLAREEVLPPPQTLYELATSTFCTSSTKSGNETFRYNSSRSNFNRYNKSFSKSSFLIPYLYRLRKRRKVWKRTRRLWKKKCGCQGASNQSTGRERSIAFVNR